MVKNAGADIDPDRVKWKMSVPGHYTAKLGCHTEGYWGDDMGGRPSFTLTEQPYSLSIIIYYLSIIQ